MSTNRPPWGEDAWAHYEQVDALRFHDLSDDQLATRARPHRLVPVLRPDPTRVLDERAPLDPLPRPARERALLCALCAAIVFGWAIWAVWYGTS